ncbi:MAG: AbrB family transcriptional regulator [Devosia sp.]|uniref:AbrB/MazE/SpoVT family DNA-binding domain-containing protein n=1 Tax=Devosia sp. TaxID=1871048 RepID=UPI00260763C9|nr:AbrB/MazE/SpoVT family DNA-binding domain-containing protein [Devosia sp.]MDB5587029.1 AbrB family transcriptional regulator [Devosia sp.]
MATATLTTKGQMTLPKEVRDDLKVGPGDQIDIVKEKGRYVLVPHTVSIDSLAGILGKPPSGPMTIQEEEEALTQALAEEDKRIRAGR